MRFVMTVFILLAAISMPGPKQLQADVVGELDKVLKALKDPEHGYKAAMVKNHKFHVMFYYDLLNTDLRAYTQYLTIMANALAEAEFELLELAARLELEWESAILLESPSQDFPDLIRLAELADKLQADLDRIDRWRAQIVEEQALVQNVNTGFCEEDRLFYVTDLFDLSLSHQVRDFDAVNMGSALSNIYGNMTGQFQYDYFKGLEEHAKYKEPFGINASVTVSEGGGNTYGRVENQYGSKGEAIRSTVAFILATSGEKVAEGLVATAVGSLGQNAAVQASGVAAAQTAAVSIVGSALTAVGIAYFAYQVFDFVKGRLDAMKKEDKILNRVREIINFLNEPIVSSKESYQKVLAYCDEGERAEVEKNITAMTTQLKESADRDQELGAQNREEFLDWSQALWTDVILLMAEQGPADLDRVRGFVESSLVSEQQQAGYQTQFTLSARDRVIDLETTTESDEFDRIQVQAERALLRTQIEVQSDDIGLIDDNNARVLSLILERIE